MQALEADPIDAWLLAKRQELQARRTLEALAPVVQQLLNNPALDTHARALGLEIRRPAADTYQYENDRALARLLERQRNLRVQVLERQRLFRQQCQDGQRQVDVDFMPARQLTVRLLAVDADPMISNTPSPAPGDAGTPQQTRARTERRPPEVRVTTRRAPRPWLANAVRVSVP